MTHRSPLLLAHRLVDRLRLPALPGASGDPAADERHNRRVLQVEGIFAGLPANAMGSFFAVFAIALGATNTQVGMITSGPALMSLLCTIPIGRLLQRSRGYVRPIQGALIAHRLLLMALALIPWLPESLRPMGVVALVMLATAPAAVREIGWQSICGVIFSPTTRAYSIGSVWAATNLTSMAWMLLMGHVTDVAPFPVSYQIIFGAGGFIALASVWLMARVRLPDMQPIGSLVADAPRRGLGPGDLWRRYRSFVLFEVGILIGYLAIFGAMPLYPTYWVRDLGAAGIWLGVMPAAFRLGSTPGNLLWGRWLRPDRQRLIGLITNCGTMGLYPLATALFTNLTPLVGVCAVAGFLDGGNGVVVLNRLIQVSPKSERPTLLAIHSMLANVCMLIAPLISTALVDVLGTRSVLVGVGLLGLLGGVTIYFLGWGAAPAGAD
jgi:hypothetical protein